MRIETMAVLLIVLASPAARAQTPESRWYAGAVAAIPRISADDVDSGGTSSAGGVFGVRLTRFVCVELEASRGFGELTRAFTGRFLSFAGPGASREEIERLAITMHRDTRWKPTFTGAALIVLRSPPARRIGAAVFTGVTATRYATRATNTVIGIPAGVDRTAADISRMVPDAAGTRMQGGWTAGLMVPIAVADGTSVAPDLRYTYGSVGDERYNELRAGMRVLWRF